MATIWVFLGEPFFGEIALELLFAAFRIIAFVFKVKWMLERFYSFLNDLLLFDCVLFYFEPCNYLTVSALETISSEFARKIK